MAGCRAWLAGSPRTSKASCKPSWFARGRSQLVHSSGSLAAIEVATGFADQSQFTNACRRIAAVPPGAWRRSRP
ncbi:helix-turn-helix domain-containing protein [Methylobacterium oxalidis]|uniref:helix-turn-helix domain-containing protein n=1 Tax=Methylobacterium oxalidis TaxID=944322 RepID=UPI0038B2C621